MAKYLIETRVQNIINEEHRFSSEVRWGFIIP